MWKIKKIALVIIVAVLCCACRKTTEDVNQTGTDSAQSGETVNLQEVLERMKSEQAKPTTSHTPSDEPDPTKE